MATCGHQRRMQQEPQRAATVAAALMDIAYLHEIKGVSGVMPLTLIKGPTRVTFRAIKGMINTTGMRHLVSRGVNTVAPPRGP
jgi:hypothetical protein